MHEVRMELRGSIRANQRKHRPYERKPLDDSALDPAIVERVARAICRAELAAEIGSNGYTEDDVERDIEGAWLSFAYLAHVAIEAMQGVVVPILGTAEAGIFREEGK